MKPKKAKQSGVTILELLLSFAMIAVIGYFFADFYFGIKKVGKLFDAKQGAIAASTSLASQISISFASKRNVDGVQLVQNNPYSLIIHGLINELKVRTLTLTAVCDSVTGTTLEQYDLQTLPYTICGTETGPNCGANERFIVVVRNDPDDSIAGNESTRILPIPLASTNAKHDIYSLAMTFCMESTVSDVGTYSPADGSRVRVEIHIAYLQHNEVRWHRHTEVFTILSAVNGIEFIKSQRAAQNVNSSTFLTQLSVTSTKSRTKLLAKIKLLQGVN